MQRQFRSMVWPKTPWRRWRSEAKKWQRSQPPGAGAEWLKAAREKCDNDSGDQKGGTQRRKGGVSLSF
jgi:hypothetical protein